MLISKPKRGWCSTFLPFPPQMRPRKKFLKILPTNEIYFDWTIKLLYFYFKLKVFCKGVSTRIPIIHIWNKFYANKMKGWRGRLLRITIFCVAGPVVGEHGYRVRPVLTPSLVPQFTKLSTQINNQRSNK